MKLKSLRCPNCDADLEVEDGLDTFFCKYCGHKILLEGQSKAAYDAKVRIKKMEHEEKIQDKRDAQERYKMEFKHKEDKAATNGLITCVLVMIFLIIVIILIVNNNNNKYEQLLQTTVDQIMIDIENEDFSAAYIKANSLYSSSDKWNAIRKEIINQIEKAEEKATGTITHIQEESADENEDNNEKEEDILDEILNIFD